MSKVFKSRWQPVSAWAGTRLAQPSGTPPIDTGVTLTPIGHLPMLTLIVAQDGTAAFADLVRNIWSLEVPARGHFSASDETMLLYAGPDQYLLASRHKLDVSGLVTRFTGVAAISEQGDGRACVEIRGPESRRLLNKGLSLDLHPSVFEPGSCASTALAHGAVQLALLDAAPTWLLLVPRTVAVSLADWLCEAAAEFGFTIASDRLSDFGTLAA